ncbi:hypothetical protein BD311DRAFT_766838 [Dichomitus squalens]|uniref:Uncharacterized protein n=1 Tax=Dichomitus squalens TaxID=114155 RepID=A0A4Q9PYI6_9APHY|nr:hypothetical protein BD311DRAFT_766838 [Dichomitus squalens]TBU59833.1 hypothetical protein BD310DRAFT_924329 [Dichomitus squalens]
MHDHCGELRAMLLDNVTWVCVYPVVFCSIATGTLSAVSHPPVSRGLAPLPVFLGESRPGEYSCGMWRARSDQ